MTETSLFLINEIIYHGVALGGALELPCLTLLKRGGPIPIILEPNASISFKYWLLFPLSHMLRHFFFFFFFESNFF